MSAYRRAVHALAVVFVVYGLLVATHLGEFWPFSIYPMFSQGGRPWSRAVVRVVPEDVPTNWATAGAETLPGRPYALAEHGVNALDLAGFLTATETWDADRVDGLRTMLEADGLHGRALLVMRVNGRIAERDSVVMRFKPYAHLTSDTTQLHPSLPVELAGVGRQRAASPSVPPFPPAAFLP
jgi:hypothetical protein